MPSNRDSSARYLIAALCVLLSGCAGELPQRSADSGWSPPLDSAGTSADSGGPATPDSGGPAAVCGDGSCDPGEHCASCPADCGGCAPQTTTLQVVADSYVDEGTPTANHGQAAVLVTDQSPDQQALLRFSVASLPGALQKALLRIYVTNGSSNGPAVHVTTDPWTELGVTWNNRPKPSGAALTDLGSVPKGAWLEIDVTKAVTGAGSLAFILAPTGTDGLDLHSRENTSAPQLVITTAGGPPPPDAGLKLDGAQPTPDAGPGVDAAPSPDSAPPGPTAFSFFAVGDTRSNPTVAQQSFKSMTLLDPKAIAVFNSGDLTPDGTDSQWQGHVNEVTLGSGGKIRMDLTGWSPSFIRYFGIVGNHDTHDSSWLTSWNKYLPGQTNLGTAGASGVYFAVTHGNAIFIVLDSQNTSSSQTSWLKTTLAAAAANPAIVWKLVFYHHPVYPCNYKSPWSSGIPWVREFEAYKVDMVFNGHAHTYERTCPMVGGKCQAGGVQYVISGGGGAGTGAVSPSKTDKAGTDSYDCGQILKMAKGSWHHYCRIGIDGKKLSYDCYKYNTTASPEDTLTVVK